MAIASGGKGGRVNGGRARRFGESLLVIASGRKGGRANGGRARRFGKSLASRRRRLAIASGGRGGRANGGSRSREKVLHTEAGMEESISQTSP